MHAQHEALNWQQAQNVEWEQHLESCHSVLLHNKNSEINISIPYQNLTVPTVFVLAIIRALSSNKLRRFKRCGA